MKEILNRLTNYETLSEKEARDIIIQISEGKLNTSEISSFLTIFMIRNITIDELNGFRKALIDLSLNVHPSIFPSSSFIFFSSIKLIVFMFDLYLFLLIQFVPKKLLSKKK